ncbi:MAG: hypothetical protein JNM27_01000 [Leptospirales bacterium]|nr:hypothetical protein [Leptospirales bacterium]
MLKLVFRQILRHWKGLLPILILWIVGGIWIAKNKNSILTTLARASISPPGVGEQNEDKAYEILHRHEQDVKEVRLDLMQKACSSLPLKYRGDAELLRPHWLERYKDWNLQTNPEIPPGPEDVVEPSQYWRENRAAVIAALKDSIDATVYAFEIFPGNSSRKETIIVAHLVEKYARAACLDSIPMLVYGDYLEYLEANARNKIIAANKNFELEYPAKIDQDLFILEFLKTNGNYSDALRRFGGGAIPESRKACKGRDYRLACISFPDAQDALRKLTYIAPSAELPQIFLSLGRLHLLKDSDDHFRRSANYFSGATFDHGTEKEGRAGMIRAYLGLGRNDLAFEQLQQLSLLFQDKGRTDVEFRELARLVLTKIGRLKDADCYADLSDLPVGGRSHCENVNLK